MSERRMLDVKQAADEIGVSTDLVLAWISEGELRAVQVGRHRFSRRPLWRIQRSDLDAFIERRGQTKAHEKV
jgi:excisionase family DNA binding protein